MEDPALDARSADPLWRVGTEGLLHVRACGAREGAAPTARPADGSGVSSSASSSSASAGSGQPRFSLWALPGRKRVTHGGGDLTVTAVDGPQHLRFTLSAEVEEGSAFSLAVPLDGKLRVRLPAYQAQLRAIAGERPQPAFRPATRSALLHLRALQAHDAAQAGARQRDIAAALFGAAAVKDRWSADSELRAQVRHLLGRAEGLVRGGYLALAGVRPEHADIPGEGSRR